MNVGIVGGGIMGISLGYFLTKAGATVTIFEASPELGGLAGPLLLEDGTAVDRFYHAILSSDSHLGELCTELDIADQLRFNETKMGFYYQNDIYSMNNIIEFLRFPPLGWVDRFRLGVTVLAAQLVRDWHKLESVSVQEWLVRYGGLNVYKNIWRPMLRAKFDGGFDDVPATWVWSRLVRMKSTRDGANQKEEAGHLIGGYSTLLKAMARKIEAAGGQIYLHTAVDEIVVRDGRACGIQVKGEMRPFDVVVGTVQSPLFSHLIPGADDVYRAALAEQEYLGIVCPLLVLTRPLTDYWTLNITDDTIPFTGVIETTTYIDPQYVGGYHLVYLPKYTAPGSPWQQKSDAEIETIWLENLQRMLPNFDPQTIRYFQVNRTRYVEPLHGLNEMDKIPATQTPIHNLYLATTAQIYPALTNGESVSRHARQVADQISAAVPTNKCSGVVNEKQTYSQPFS
ncbi:MAG: NAD(P)/FAD-dependent oxidoreductase [Chloroflexi bacterium]|nr:NAD(P)/FAD-dependent oxidoreductase [Chloroflexota bacterium]